ncbi:MAG TPA: TetR/AcrR family transcriptional regulator [Solirubrobacteraceae bacterium]|nr:TetR/AcrR family transcriptional regulator [Solirubrobacteraceae bacterium]
MQPGTEPERTFIETARRAQIVAAAIDTIAEVGYAQATLGRIAERIGISRGLISYHFAGKDELVAQVVSDVVDQAKEDMWPPIFAATTGSEVLRAYIESSLAFTREHPNHKMALLEITRNSLSPDGPRFDGDAHEEAVRNLEDLLAHFQAAGQLRADLNPRATAIAIRAAIDAAGARLTFDKNLDIEEYARDIANLFDLGTRNDAPQRPTSTASRRTG